MDMHPQPTTLPAVYRGFTLTVEPTPSDWKQAATHATLLRAVPLPGVPTPDNKPSAITLVLSSFDEQLLRWNTAEALAANELRGKIEDMCAMLDAWLDGEGARSISAPG